MQSSYLKKSYTLDKCRENLEKGESKRNYIKFETYLDKKERE